jgi:hypothetical protein
MTTLTLVAFIRVKNVKGESIDSRIPQDFPYQNFNIEESESARYVASGYEVMNEFDYAQMIIALQPEMEAYQNILNEEQKQTEIFQKLEMRSLLIEKIILGITAYLENNLNSEEMRAFSLNAYTYPMFNQIRALQFELAIQYAKAHPGLTEEQKNNVSKLITDNHNLAL